MKNLNIIFTIVLFSIGLNAQVKLGVKSFYSVSLGGESEVEEFINYQEARVHEMQALKSSSRKGIGLTIMAENDKLFTLADVAYMTATQNFSLNSTSFIGTRLDPSQIMKSKTNSTRLNVIGGVKVKNLKIGVGPELTIGLDNEENISDIKEITTDITKLKTGFNFLVGYEILKAVQIDLKYSFLFNDVSDDFSYQQEPMDLKANEKFIELSLGIFIP